MTQNTQALIAERDEARRLVLWALDLLPPSIGRDGALEATKAWGEVPDWAAGSFFGPRAESEAEAPPADNDAGAAMRQADSSSTADGPKGAP